MLERILCLAVMAGTYCGVLPDPDPLPVQAPLVAVAPPQSTPAAEPAPIDYLAVQNYLWHLDARTLIEIAWEGTGQTATALKIAQRESGFNCAAKNRHSSASGVFQMLSLHRGFVEHLGYRWADIPGPSCYPDVMAAFALWQGTGWRPWRM